MYSVNIYNRTARELCNKLHMLKIDFKTSKMSKVQILLNVAKQASRGEIEILQNDIRKPKRITRTILYANTKF